MDVKKCLTKIYANNFSINYYENDDTILLYFEGITYFFCKLSRTAYNSPYNPDNSTQTQPVILINLSLQFTKLQNFVNIIHINYSRSKNLGEVNMNPRLLYYQETFKKNNNF